jgi:hypothetical protein
MCLVGYLFGKQFANSKEFVLAVNPYSGKVLAVMVPTSFSSKNPIKTAFTLY